MNWLDFLHHILLKRKVLIFNFLLTVPLALLVGWNVKLYYKSEVAFLPPEANSGLGIAGLLAGNMGLGGSDIMDTYYHLNTSQIKMIVESPTLRSDLVRNFALIESYNLKKSKKPMTDALKILDKRIMLEEIEKTGLGFSEVVGFRLAVSDTSATKAFEMAVFFFKSIQNTVNRISSDKARNAKVFLESRLQQNKADLASAEAEMLAFQTKYKVLDIPMQLKEAIQVYADLKSSIVMRSMDLNMQKSDYLNSSRNTTVIENQIRAMEKELGLLENKSKADYLVGLKNAPELYFRHIELSKNVEMYQRLDLLLLQNLEYTKIQESKSLNSLQVIDEPTIPEYKYKPKRILIVLFIVAIEMLFVFSLLFWKYYYTKVLQQNADFKKLLSAFDKNPR